MVAYFDNSATTKPTEEVVAAVTEMLTETFGNPSSLHFQGDLSAAVLEQSRKTVAKSLGCSPEEVFFTSGGTESNNLAVTGAARALRRSGSRVVTSCVEHPSVLECMKRLEDEGFEVVYLPVDASGNVREEDIRDAVNDRTVLISLMLVNNEVGSILPVEKLKGIARAAGAPALIHTDAVQAFGKIPVNVRNLGVDLLSFSGHKVHGPKGVGVLYVRKGVRLVPHMLGGGQENGLRSGTQNMPGIAGLAAAVSGMGDISVNAAHAAALKSRLLTQLEGADGLQINSPEGFPYILNLSVSGIPSEVLRNFLSECGVCVSTGSACSKGHRSYVLTAMGLQSELIDTAIRISFSRFNTVEETDLLAESLLRANTSLRKRSR